MANKSVSDLKSGDRVTLKFHGSKQFGNEPYEMTEEFREFYTENGRPCARFESFSAYKEDNRWRYGTSGEVLTVLSVA